jgi:AAA domain
MSTNYWFKSLEVSNYRGLRHLEVPHFRRVNLIGGLNGSGKTTLLESLFTIADWKHPLSVVKHSLWRQLPGSVEVVSKFTFTDGDRTKPIKIFVKTRDGGWKLEERYELQPPPPVQQVSTTAAEGQTKQSTGNVFGITMEVSKDNTLEDLTHFTDATTGLQLFKERASQIGWPVCSLITKTTLVNPTENAERFSYAVQTKNKSRVIALTQIATPWTRDLQLLQMGGTTQLCGEVAPDVFVPLSLLGDGALTLTAIGMAIIQCENGAVLLDEFDTAIHFSRLKVVWTEIAKLADQFNCQVFAATHSRECIQAAAEGLRDANLKEDLQYMRLDRGEAGDTACTIYKFNELENALEESWEVR